ncbi:MAG TPA: Hint domain-containing protein, partial [Acetobacteraceae bacterium]|nr:Hint domain-containing protein [Acetobacteraceae bacterium]
GTGKVLATRGRRNPATPVIVRKDALASGVPHHDLRVTKGHSLYLDDVLIPVEYLVNHRSIIWDDRAQEVNLYHIELETHDVLVANGAPAESYRDDGNRWLFRNANSGWDLPPLPPCAPLLTGGPVVDALWRRLLDRAGPRPGLPLTDDPDLHLLVDGRRIDASPRPNGLRVFHLPRRPSEIRVASHAASPAELGLSRDPRPLGVAVRQVRLWQGARLRTLDASDPSLTEGFHAFEPDNSFRWTNGDATLPTTLFQDLQGACQVELRLGSAMRYPLFTETPRKAA